jgi:hypothetical protein
MTRADAYLAIPRDYARSLGGLRWHPGGEAIEFAAESPKVGLTFAMAPEVALFLEGFASARDLVCFGHILHMMTLLGCGDPEAGEAVETGPDDATRALGHLARSFRGLGRPLRNAGALLAKLGRGIPTAAEPPEIRDVRAILTYGYAGMFAGPDARGEQPPLPPRELQSAVARALLALSDDEVDHWLRHGRGPVGDAGEAVARAAEATRPRSLAALLDALDGRERLAGAARLVPLLDGALSLPPRRLAPAELPTGGYADVATRGLPEQILPAQFALDDLEFLRRFAERELLYYHREEPRTPKAEELIVVLDQGVRTWGDVRLVLAAAAIALGRQAARRRLTWLVATTADDGTIVDPMALADPEALGPLLEASDLSTNPGLALERVLEAPADRPRDVVLLTHPRSLDESDVCAAARRAGPGTRLFAVAVDDAGRVGLAEVRRGAPVTLSRCRVEVRRDPEPAPPPRRVGRVGPWTGDVEPIGFPFTLGVLGPVQDGHFDFDEGGEWLLVAGRHGSLHAWRVDGSAAEMLPRGALDGRVLASVEAVVGVAGGFAVAGTLGEEGRAVVVHYDFRSRRCRVHDFGAWRPEREWFYLREYHAVAVYEPSHPACTAAVDLATGSGSASVLGDWVRRKGPPTDRALRARQEASHGPPDRARVTQPSAREDLPGLFAKLEPGDGSVRIWRRKPGDQIFTQFAGGGPVLVGKRLLSARLAGGVVALGVVHERLKPPYLDLFELSGGRPLGGFALSSAGAFALSRDGRLLARRLGGPAIEVRDAGGSVAAPLLVTPRGKTHQVIDIYLGVTSLALRGGKVAHVLDWSDGPLRVRRDASPPTGAKSPWRAPLPVTAYDIRALELDHRRFVGVLRHRRMTVLTDVFGQVAVLDGAGRFVAMFFVFRDTLAGWLPDGTRFGPPSLIGGPESPGALERIGAALRAALGARREGAAAP